MSLKTKLLSTLHFLTSGSFDLSANLTFSAPGVVFQVCCPKFYVQRDEQMHPNETKHGFYVVADLLKVLGVIDSLYSYFVRCLSLPAQTWSSSEFSMAKTESSSKHKNTILNRVHPDSFTTVHFYFFTRWHAMTFLLFGILKRYCNLNRSRTTHLSSVYRRGYLEHTI